MSTKKRNSESPIGLIRFAGIARRFSELEAELAAERSITDALRDALEMVRDADDDCRRDGLQTIPNIARTKIGKALAR